MLELFSVPIHSEKLSLDTKKLIDYCLFIRNNNKSIDLSNRGGWHSPSLTGEHAILNNLFLKILESAEKYREVINYKHPLKLTNLWININNYKDYNIEHSHPNCVVSGAYYLTSNNSNIVFVHPAAQLMEYDWNFNVINSLNKYNSPNWSINPSQNELLLFPSWLSHRVEPNLSEENRISISFNLR